MQWSPKFKLYKGFPKPSKDEPTPCFLTLCVCVCVREGGREREREDICFLIFYNYFFLLKTLQHSRRKPLL
jgi:hypothetical protein